MRGGVEEIKWQVIYYVFIKFDLALRVIAFSQGGRYEFEIGVAYNKVGQKYPNKDIFEASRQKARRPDDQKTGWSDDRMIRWPEVWMTR